MKVDVRIGTFKTRDGLKLHFEHWSPLVPKGTIFFLHGMGDHCGRYKPFISYFTDCNYRLCLYDQRGHGRSQGKRAHISRFEIFLEDLWDFYEFSHCDGVGADNCFLVGHSLGGQIALNFLAKHPQIFQRACLASPCLKIALTMPAWQERAARFLRPLWPTKRLKGLAKPHLFSHDPDVMSAYLKDPYVSTFVTIGMGYEILKNLETIYALCHKIKTPTLVLHGLDDQICSVEGAKHFFKDLRLAQKRLKLYEGKYHELLNEVNREEVFKEMERWFAIV